MRREYGVLLTVCCTMLGLLACGSSDPTPVADRTDPADGKWTIPSWLEPSAPPERLRVLVDVSGSMRGFISAGTAHMEVLERVRDIALRVGVDRVTFQEFSNDLAPPKNLDHFRNPAVYSRAETNLTIPFDSTATTSAREAFLAVTDGVASLRHGTASGSATGNAAFDCDSGNDVACVTRSVLRYVAGGGAVWLIGIRSPFSGTYWIEQGPRRGEKLDENVRVERPLYLWIGSGNVAFGRRLAREVLAFAERPGIEIELLEISPGASSSMLVERAKLKAAVSMGKLRSQRCEARRGQLPDVVGIIESVSDTGIVSNIRVRIREPRGFLCAQIPVQEAGNTWPFPSLYEWRQELHLTGPSPRTHFAYTPTGSNEPAVLVHLDFSRGAVRDGSQFRFVSKWVRTDPEGDQWWRAWSTDRDDSEEFVDRTLNLALLLDNLRARLHMVREEEAVFPWLRVTFRR